VSDASKISVIVFASPELLSLEATERFLGAGKKLMKVEDGESKLPSKKFREILRFAADNDTI